jgi:hypothetical protein
VVTEVGRALNAGQDTKALARRVNEAHDSFLATGRAGARVRPLVVKSWQRCLSSGVDPEASLAPVDLVDGELERWRQSHPLADVMPLIRRLLVADAADAGLLVAVSDAAGRLLWVEGQSRLKARAERIHFVEGATWSEGRAGTNAPGTALALDQPVQIFQAEHLSRPVTGWSCSAAPIHDPDTGAILGALDLTGGDDVAAPHTLSLVRATIAAAEREIRLGRLLDASTYRRPDTDPATSGGLLLHALGRPGALLQRPDGSTRLSPRHGELLTLLAAHPDGLTGEQLSSALHVHDFPVVTLRAELSRLRTLLAPIALHPRPYRLGESVHTDSDQVTVLLDRGEVGAAVELYCGPLLPLSDAPGVVRLRQDLHEQLRAALLTRGDADALLGFGDTDHGRFDWQIWQAAWSRMLPSSSRREQVRAHLRFLDQELGLKL